MAKLTENSSNSSEISSDSSENSTDSGGNYSESSYFDDAPSLPKTTPPKEVAKMAMNPTLLVHLYRAEVTRELALLQRLDATTNVAVGIASGLTVLVFSTEELSSYFIFVIMALVVFFCVLEARRFSAAELSRKRARGLEKTAVLPAIFGQVERETPENDAKTPENGAKTPENGAKTAENGVKTAENGANHSHAHQNRSKTHHRHSKTHQNRTKKRHKSANCAPDRPKMPENRDFSAIGWRVSPVSPPKLYALYRNPKIAKNSLFRSIFVRLKRVYFAILCLLMVSFSFLAQKRDEISVETAVLAPILFFFIGIAALFWAQKKYGRPGDEDSFHGMF